MEGEPRTAAGGGGGGAEEVEHWRENVRLFRDSVDGDRKAAATPQVIAGNPFGIKLLRLLPLRRRSLEQFEGLRPLLPL
ncbi:hypothetical protein [Oryza sativa Japonica Group]|uniref:Uncharacterized protein P0511C01.5 n=1 Tax=Oryza sativa subsp. japonica TaxID=39947 RepID=Q5NB19_ORYSJ|nr:hypothetical protein [Oryza sativa Japonica Group]